MARARTSAVVLLAATATAACVKTKPTEEGSGDGAASAAATARASGALSGALSVEECEKVLVGAELNLAKLRLKAPKTCASDDDCVLVASTACIPGCVDHPLAKSAKDGYDKARGRIRSAECSAWTAGDCEKTTPKPAPACPALTLACVEGTCVARGP